MLYSTIEVHRLAVEPFGEDDYVYSVTGVSETIAVESKPHLDAGDVLLCSPMDAEVEFDPKEKENADENEEKQRSDKFLQWMDEIMAEHEGEADAANREEVIEQINFGLGGDDGGHDEPPDGGDVEPWDVFCGSLGVVNSVNPERNKRWDVKIEGRHGLVGFCRSFVHAVSDNMKSLKATCCMHAKCQAFVTPRGNFEKVKLSPA